MSSRRLEKAAEAIREVVSMAILAELNDPAHPRRHGDLRRGVGRPAARQGPRFGDGRRGPAETELRGLQSAAGFLQAKIAERIEIRYTPKLSFLLDQGVKRSIAVAQILQEVLPKEPAARRRARTSDDAADESAADEPKSADHDPNEPSP